MKPNMITVIALTLPIVAACGETQMENMRPERPELGTQIDRQGRAAITTALVSVLVNDIDKGTDRDAYNAAGPADWQAYTQNIEANLAVYDALDTVCGNQLLADANPDDRYSILAGALADDRLYVNTDSGRCGQYMSVELDATGVLANDDCGGRTPSYDVVDVTYSALAIGAVAGVTDGVPADDGSTSSSVFPFLSAP